MRAALVLALVFALACAVFLLLAPTSLSAQEAATPAATLSGRVTTPDGAPVADAVVTLVELRRSVKTGTDGSFRFESIRPGHYHVQAESRRLGTAVGEADLEAGASRSVEVVLDRAVHSEEVVVTASPDARRESELYQPVAILDAQEIADALRPSLGETLSSQPGVSSTSFGPGASRPVIRGLGADRIRVLEDGVTVGDASNVSEDHAVSLDPATAQRVEIVRGPATLLYGSNAVGGAVNVLADRIPDHAPTQPVTGSVDLRLGTAADERNGSFSLGGALGSRLAWHADLAARKAHDVDIPGAAKKLENSFLEAASGSAGLSYVGERGFLGVSYSALSTTYGIPGHEVEDGESLFVHIDLDQRRFDVKGELRELGFLRGVKVRFGGTDYEHTELENEEAGTRFTNEAYEGRLEAVHAPLGPLSGSIGVQVSRSDLAAIGAEAFLLPNVTSTRAAFLFEEIRGDRWDFQLGGRYEHQATDVEGNARPGRSFDGLSASLGTIFRPSEGWALALSLARAERLPTSSELYADGPHVATEQFEIGDVDLGKETSLGLDLSLRRTAGPLRGTFNIFLNRFDDFIHGMPTGEERDGLPVFQFAQTDAGFWGIELDTHTEVYHSGQTHLELEVGGDYVRGERRGGGGDLPRIPPFRAHVGLRLESGPVTAMAEVRHVARQSRVADFEEPTGGYTLVNALLRFRFFTGGLVHDLFARGTNLTDQLARNHVSPLKDRAPLPGRDVTIGYRLAF